MVKRYNPVRQHGGCIMVEYDDGEYVRHREHAALAERCERLERALRAAKDDIIWWQREHSCCPIDRKVMDQIDGVLSGISGGKDG